MRIVEPDPRAPKRLAATNCPCACGGEGVLIFRRCVGCGTIVLECSEIGTVYMNPHDLTKPGNWIHDSSAVCGQCETVRLCNFANPTEDEIIEAGFMRGELRTPY
jgi:hypothetical protein